MTDRSGKRKPRDRFIGHRKPELGYYLIVTDTEKTEQNYLHGLRNSIPKELQGRIVIKVCKAKTEELVSDAINIASLHPQYCEPWIVFDRDQVTGFDEIISAARKYGIHTGWSNPCIEIWFHAYFGGMPSCQDSMTCCRGFEKKYLQATQQEYKKDDAAIYAKLCRYGDEEEAISIAVRKLEEHENSGKVKPSELCPGTTLHQLISEINERWM